MTGDPPADGLPSDSAILEFIDGCDTPPSVKEVARAFSLPQESRSPLRRRLRQLAEQGRIAKQPGRRIAAPDQLPEVTVLIVRKIDRDGTLLAVPASETSGPAPSVRLTADRRGGRAARVGQQVLARLKRISGARYEGRIIRVLDSTPRRLFGTVVAGRGGLILQQAERGGRDTITLERNVDMPATEGDLVEAELLPRRGYLGKTARIIDNLGPADAPGAYGALALVEFDIPHVFPDDAIAGTDGMKVPDLRGRTDLRDRPFVTIDGADARDFDDAVHAEPRADGGWQVSVAIADVAHYVRPNSALDTEARRRGNSVYLPDRVVPMLPEALSNDLCSLRPHEPRAAMVVEMDFDAAGQMTDSRFMRALIRSAARLTYDQVQAWHEGQTGADDIGASDEWLTNLFGAWQALDTARQAREPLALNLKERRVLLDDDGLPAEIVQRAQSQSQRLIEDYMIAANVAAAQTLIRAKQPCVFRVHDQPDPDRANGLHDLAAAVGARLARGQVLRPHHFNTILGHVAGTPDEKMINEAVLRSQAKAIYSTDNIGHFGLSLRDYAHFTSPIRRYSDLLVHRALIDMLATGSAPRDGLGGVAAPDLIDVCEHISETESRAAAAERRTIDRFAAALFVSRAGTIVEGIVAGVTKSGAFISLEDGAADGFLPMRSLPDDYYVIDDAGMRMRGRHNGLSVAVGDKMDVLVVEVTPVSGGILLAYVGGGADGGGAHRPRKSSDKPGGKPGGKHKSKGGSKAGSKSGAKKGRKKGAGKNRTAKGQGRNRRTD
ncbi:MAG: ribonuclease R [SAR116 cluster bacterium]|nr:ribonuclease R [SAR116 cluster bacterium]RPG98006.1 MAG: ribonuclease R [Candidatus Puniceispirillum sp. TMED176]